MELIQNFTVLFNPNFNDKFVYMLFIPEQNCTINSSDNWLIKIT